MQTESIIIIIFFLILFTISIVIGSIALNKVNANQILKDIGITNDQLKNIESEVEDYVSQKFQNQLDSINQKIDSFVKFNENNSATQLCIGATCITPDKLDVLNGSKTFRFKSECNGVLNKTQCTETNKVAFINDTDNTKASYFRLDHTPMK